MLLPVLPQNPMTFTMSNTPNICFQQISKPISTFTSTFNTKKFCSLHYLSDNLVKTQEFYQLILIDSQSVTITHILQMNIVPILLCSPNASLDGFLHLTTGRIPLLIETFLNQIIPKALITMTGMVLGIPLST